MKLAFKSGSSKKTVGIQLLYRSLLSVNGHYCEYYTFGHKG